MSEDKELLRVTAMPVGHAARAKKWAEEDARARAYKEEQDRKKAQRIEDAKKRREEFVEGGVLRKYWDNFETIAFVQKTARQKYEIGAGTRDGGRFVSIREYYFRKYDQQWIPSKNGIAIPVMYPMSKTKRPDPDNPIKFVHPAKDVLPAIQKAFEVAQTMELSDPDKAIYFVLKPFKRREKQDEDC